MKFRRRNHQYLVILFTLTAVSIGIVLCSYISIASFDVSSRPQLPIFLRGQDGMNKYFSLEQRVLELEKEISSLSELLTKVKSENADLMRLLDGCVDNDLVKVNKHLDDLPKREASERYKEMVYQLSELNNSVPLRNEFEVVPYELFIADRVFRIDPGVGKRVVEMFIGHRKQELTEVIALAKTSLLEVIGNGTAPAGCQFTEGIHRTVPVVGSVYELLFNCADNQNRAQITNGKTSVDVKGKTWYRVKQFRPFTRLEQHSIERLDFIDSKAASKSAVAPRDVHIIVPFQQRVDMLTRFLERTVTTMQADDGFHVHIVSFGAANTELQIQNLIRKILPVDQQSRIRVLTVNDTVFSRVAALHLGALSLLNASSGGSGNNTLMFFCDVDMAFTAEFLRRCRVHAEPGRSVYYPIVFSLYNPLFTRSGEPSVEALRAFLRSDGRLAENLTQTLSISRESGYWRDFGFGMSCHFLSDYLETGRFAWNYSQPIAGLNQTGGAAKDGAKRVIGSGRTAGETTAWGLEDVNLYLQYLRSGRTRVVRASDPAIFHLYHTKHCDRSRMTWKQYDGCLRSRAISEGSQTQLGTALLNLVANSP